ncbi:uracil nucleotide/cysteinyl leukotriene receptor [Gouania willdenowi]|uniref:uracil nucleotide/cysteinyl leukotriene receptor n=1 Tax=Gouania willdenowi TaxID=441366 RepID=UPI001055E304|nr:uracil nucleotide/cysteinyl leukotriene receptor-like [Gouania willdenowi]
MSHHVCLNEKCETVKSKPCLSNFCYTRMVIPSTAMNTSEEQRESFCSTSMPFWNIALSTYYILILIIAVPGNVLALWAFFHQKITSPTKVFLSGLAVADISYVLILPLRIVYHLMACRWPFELVLCRITGFLFHLNMYCSIYLMSFISLDRFLAVVVPLKSKSIRKPLYAKVSMCILWGIVIVSMCPTLFPKNNQAIKSSICTAIYLEKSSITAFYSTIVAFGIPLTSVILSYMLILLKLRALKQQSDRQVKDKVRKTIFFIMTHFLVAFVPYHVSRVIYIKSHITGPITAAREESLAQANQITSALACMNAALDPVMYFFLNRAYRDQSLKLFSKPRQQEQ